MTRKLLSLSVVAASLLAQDVVAQPSEDTLRPMVRPASEGPVATLIKASAAAAGIENALRPKQRPATIAGQAQPVMQSVTDAGFDDWISGFQTRARATGIRQNTLDAAFSGVRLDPEVIRRDRNQSEFTKTIWEYLGSAASQTRIANGKVALETHGSTLAAIEEKYGVEKEVVVAIWGLESAYGTYRGSDDVVRSLATLSYEGRRGAFFEQQLIAALEILQNGDTAPRNMTGSWAGAMGHTQFIPTSYLSYAVDFTGDGRRDIWSDDPTDALASAANYLKRSGWTEGQPWGVEVQLPQGFDYRLADRKIIKTPDEWAQMGVVGMSGRAVSDHGKAAILLPAGAKGAAFMIFDNFAVIERYNTADAYVIGVGHLSDRITGGAPIRSSWPTADRALTFSERKEMQRRLTQAGFSTQGIDGRVGPKTIDAIRAYQVNRGLVPDGYASLALLSTLR
ncbi:MAG: lytic murein transglycosylase [Pseudomonadota bacterium]